MENITLLQLVSLGLGLIGALLGVMNTWRNFDKDKIKLKVKPAHAIPFGPGIDQNINFVVTVTNLSAFAVTVTDVGVSHWWTRARSTMAVAPMTIPDGGLPFRLEPRSQLSVYSQTPGRHEGKKIRRAYAKTACGETFTGNSPALKQIARRDT